MLVRCLLLLFLQSDIAAPGFQEYEMSLRLMQMGATVRNSSSYLRMKLNPDKMLPSNVLGAMSTGQLIQSYMYEFPSTPSLVYVSPLKEIVLN